MPTLIYHLAEAEHWGRALQDGRYAQSSRGVTLDQVGFIHASSWEQLGPVAQRFYTTASARLLVLEIDVDGLAAAGSLVRYEHADPDDPDSPLYPHVFGPLPTSCVCRVLSAGFDDSGAFVVQERQPLDGRNDRPPSPTRLTQPSEVGQQLPSGEAIKRP